MHISLLFLTSIPAIFALPTPARPGAAQCEYSFFEKFNMGHNHDVNTGTILLGGTVIKGAPRLLGSGCSPAWAVGGPVTDDTPTKTGAGKSQH